MEGADPPGARLAPGDILPVVTLPRLAQGGEALGRAPDGRIVFVRGAAPDERVDVRLVEVKKRFLRAEVERVLRPGPSRVEPPCAYQEACGGCPLMHLEVGAQAERKLEAGLETLARVGGQPWPRAQVGLWRAPSLGARTRARFAVSGAAVGFRAARSRDVVGIDRCIVLHPRLDAARAALAEVLRARPLPPLPSGETVEVEVVTDGVRSLARLPPALADRAPALTARGVESDPSAALRVVDPAGELLLRPDVFAQASLQGNAALLEAVAAALPERGDRALELHAGSGNFTRLLAARFARVDAVEIAGAAVALGRSLGLEGVTWRVEPALEGWRAALRRGPPELLLVDPPRAGLGTELAEAVARAPPRRVVYVSCDVATLARDLRIFAEGGLAPTELRAFDLYPHTPHLEWCVHFALNRRAPPCGA